MLITWSAYVVVAQCGGSLAEQGDKRTAFTFNIGEEVYQVLLPDNVDQREAKVFIDSGIVDITANVILKERGEFELNIPSRRQKFVGAYSALFKCLDSPLVVYSWKDKNQQNALDKIRFELDWVAGRPGEYSRHRSSGVKLYITKDAEDLLKKWHFTFEPEDLRIRIRGGKFVDLLGDEGSENQLVLIDKVGRQLNFFVQEWSGKTADYTLNDKGVLVKN